MFLCSNALRTVYAPSADEWMQHTPSPLTGLAASWRPPGCAVVLRAATATCNCRSLSGNRDPTIPPSPAPGQPSPPVPSWGGRISRQSTTCLRALLRLHISQKSTSADTLVWREQQRGLSIHWQGELSDAVPHSWGDCRALQGGMARAAEGGKKEGKEEEDQGSGGGRGERLRTATLVSLLDSLEQPVAILDNKTSSVCWANGVFWELCGGRGEQKKAEQDDDDDDVDQTHPENKDEPGAQHQQDNHGHDERQQEFLDTVRQAPSSSDKQPAAVLWRGRRVNIAWEEAIQGQTARLWSAQELGGFGRVSVRTGKVEGLQRWRRRERMRWATQHARHSFFPASVGARRHGAELCAFEHRSL